MKEIYCKIYGNVQGVTFRQFAKIRAGECLVTGYAKNLDDGTVEIVAQGQEENLKQFLASVSAGPEEAEVESLNVMWGPVEVPMKEFEIQ